MTTTAPVAPRTHGPVAPPPSSVIKAFALRHADASHTNALITTSFSAVIKAFALRHADISHANALITTWFGGWFGKRMGGVGWRLPGVGGRRG
jgi:hypothetical protein